MGTPEFSVPALRVLLERAEVLAVYTQPDRAVGRGLQVQPTPVKKLALESGVPVFTPEKVSVESEVERIRNLNPDFIIVVAYGQILKPSVIDIPRWGTLNIHSSLLPRWRGAAPIHWALLSGDSKTGITTMKIVPKLDAGDILLQEETPISLSDTATSLHDRLADVGARLIIRTMSGILDGTIHPRVQNESEVTYAHKLTKEMEWLGPAMRLSEIDLRVRALNPWPGVRVLNTEGKSFKIKKGRPGAPRSTGAVWSLTEKMGSLWITALDGDYEILEIQEEGKKALSAAEFINGSRGRGLEFPMLLKEHT